MCSRNKIPPRYRDTSQWRKPTHIPTAARVAYENEKLAVEGYIADWSYARILKETAIGDRQVRKIIDRCLSTDPKTMTMFGFYACIPGTRIGPYTRRAAYTGTSPKTDPQTLKPKVGGASGMLLQCFEMFPRVRRIILSLLLQRDPENQQAAIAIRDLHALFLRELAAAMAERGMDPSREWPWKGSKRKGYEALRRWCVKQRLVYPLEYTEARLGEDALNRTQASRHRLSIFDGLRQLSARQLDFHTVDTACTILFKDPNGATARKDVERFHIGAVVSTNPVAIWGYIFVFEPAPNGDSVMELLQSSIYPTSRTGDAMSLLPNGDVVIAGMVKELHGSGFALLQFDNAGYNISATTVSAIMDIVGCAVQLGGPGKWWFRPHVEAVFGIYTRNTGQKLPSGFGTGPADPMKGDDPYKAANHLEIDAEMLVKSMDEFCLRFNSQKPAEGAAYGQKPVVAIQSLIASKSLGVFPQPLLETEDPGWARFGKIYVCDVKGGPDTTCHIWIDKRRYTSRNLEFAHDLVNKQVIASVNRFDISQVVACTKDAPYRYLGELTPDRKTRRSPMSVYQNKYLNRFGTGQVFTSNEVTPMQRMLDEATGAASHAPAGKPSRLALNVYGLAQDLQKTAAAMSKDPQDSSTRSAELPGGDAPKKPPSTRREAPAEVIRIDERTRVRQRSRR